MSNEVAGTELCLVAIVGQRLASSSPVMWSVPGEPEDTCCSTSSSVGVARPTMEEDPYWLCWTFYGSHVPGSGGRSLKVDRMSHHAKYHICQHHLQVAWDFWDSRTPRDCSFRQRYQLHKFRVWRFHETEWNYPQDQCTIPSCFKWSRWASSPNSQGWIDKDAWQFCSTEATTGAI